MVRFTYNEYKQLGGTSTEDVFNQQVARATSLVTSLIFPNTPDVNLEGFKRAIVCAIETQHAEQTNPTKSSERIGDIAVTYCTDATKSSDERVANAARQALSGTGLLCGWL